MNQALSHKTHNDEDCIVPFFVAGGARLGIPLLAACVWTMSSTLMYGADDGKKTESMNTARAASRIEALTGARTRFVWLRSPTGEGGVQGMAPTYELRCLDTGDGVERVLVAGPQRFGNPWITKDGTRVVYTVVVRPEKPDKAAEFDDESSGIAQGAMPGSHMLRYCVLRVVDWDGKNDKMIEGGVCVGGTWEWGTHGLCTGGVSDKGEDLAYVDETDAVYRINIDNPKDKVLIVKSHEWQRQFSASGDGACAADIWPGRPLTLLDLGELPVKSTAAPFVDGPQTKVVPWGDSASWICFTMSPDASHMMAGLTYWTDVSRPPTRMTIFRDTANDLADKSDFDPVPPNTTGGVWDPRWTNHLRFMTIGAGYGEVPKNKWGNYGGTMPTANNGPGEIWIGKYNAGFTAIEAWAQVTSHKDGETFCDVTPYAWIEPAAKR